MFDYHNAFSRNIGWVTPEEQERLKNSRIAIAGLGGVGGFHLLTLTRLGITRFHVSDFDHFDLHNFNRQAGAMQSTLDKPKCQTLARMAKDINPTLELREFDEGINEKNVDEFLKDVDIYVDALDFFALKAREMVFKKCAEKGIPAFTAAPLGMGAAFLAFLPNQMDFERYFCWANKNDDEKLVRFIAGLSPSMLQRPYLAVASAVNFAEKRGPSVVMACELCAGLMATQVLKYVLKRGKITAAPFGLHFDAYREKLKKTWRPLGNQNPLQWFLMKMIRKKLGLNH